MDAADNVPALAAQAGRGGVGGWLARRRVTTHWWRPKSTRRLKGSRAPGQRGGPMTAWHERRRHLERRAWRAGSRGRWSSSMTRARWRVKQAAQPSLVSRALLTNTRPLMLSAHGRPSCRRRFETPGGLSRAAIGCFTPREWGRRLCLVASPFASTAQDSSQRSNVQLLHFARHVLQTCAEKGHVLAGCPSGPSVAP